MVDSEEQDGSLARYYWRCPSVRGMGGGRFKLDECLDYDLWYVCFSQLSTFN